MTSLEHVTRSVTKTNSQPPPVQVGVHVDAASGGFIAPFQASGKWNDPAF